MNDEKMPTETIVLRFTGEILVNERQVELLLKRVVPKAEAPKPETVALATVPTKADPFKGRLMLTVKETAGVLGISDKTAYRLVQRGLLRTSRALRHIKIPKSEIERFLKSLPE